MANPAAVLYSVRVVVRPVHQPAKFVPLVHSAKLYSIPHPERHSLGEIDVVCNKQRIAIA